MSKLIISCCFLIVLNACERGGNDDYFNHSKWRMYEMDGGPLKGNPSEVQEAYYRDLNDTLFSASLSGTKTEDDIYRFDKAGNLIYRKIILDTGMIQEAISRYDKNGLSYETNFKGAGSISGRKRVSSRIGKNKYKAVVYNEGKETGTITETFYDDGQKEVREEQSTRGSVTTTLKYEKDRLRSAKWQLPDQVTELVNFYSVFDVPDSSVYRENGKVTRRDLYSFNKNGDPVYYCRVEEGRIEEQRWMKYEYDNKGNWISKIEKSDRKIIITSNDGNTHQRYPEYTLTKRIIKY